MLAKGGRQLDPWKAWNDQLHLITTHAAMEICTWEFFDTRLVVNAETDRINFFTEGSILSNLYGQLLVEPQRFLVQSIRLWGISSDIALGQFELIISDKIYVHCPAWSLSVRERNVTRIPLFIQPDQRVIARLWWQDRVRLSKGLSGLPLHATAVQCVLRGQLARPVQ